MLRELTPAGANWNRTVVCLPFAGGSASAYRPLLPVLPPGVRLLAAQFPGRQDRLTEVPFPTVPAAAAAVADELQTLRPGPLALFGHSMGALVAWEVANLLRQQDHRPDVVVVSGADAPQTRDGFDPMVLLHDENELLALGGMGPALLASKHAEDLVIRPLRADLEMLARQAGWSSGPIPARLHVLGGIADRRVPVRNLLAWRELQPDATVQLLLGGHFFIWDQLPRIVSLIAGPVHRGGREC